MRVLITGASGFVGRHLSVALEARGHVVVGAGRGGSAPLALDLQDALNLRNVVGDTRPDAVAHLAAQAFVPASIADPWYTHDVNAGGTLRLLEAIRAARSDDRCNPRVLVVGSADVYGRQPSPARLTPETAALHPANPYAASKVAAEAYAVAATAAFGLNVVVTRTFNHIGPGQNARFAVASFAQQLARIARGGDPLMWVGNLDAERDILDVRDVVAAYVLLLEGAGNAGEVYNVSSEFAVAMKEVLRQLVIIAAVGVEIRNDPARLRPSDIPRIAGDSSKLRSATGWEPKISLGVSLRDVYFDACTRLATDLRANAG